MSRSARLSVVAAICGVGCWVGGCAPRHPATTESGPAANRVAAIAAGTIVAVRPVPRESAIAASGPDPRDGVLRSLGAALVDVPDDRVAEFIVRADDGETISVMQINAENLHPGERVVLTGGSRVRLVLGAWRPQART
jgi:outer membrane lipoprotein SlyB